MARKFLYVVAFLIGLVIAGAVVYRIWGNELVRFALVPAEGFRAQPALERSRYDDAAMWVARPDRPRNPALWTPAGYSTRKAPGGAAVFFVHPTSYITPREHWNAALSDAATNARTDIFVRGQASAFNEIGEVWAPRYRQAAFGAFLTTQAESEASLSLAYRDVATAFDSFLAQIAANRPIILAGHSQGAVHLSRLLRERIAGTPLARRIVAAYVVGWPISETADLPRMGMPQCAGPDQARCLLSWESFAEPADTKLIVDTYDASIGFTGAPRKGTTIVCTNPLTGQADAAAPATANLGTLIPSADLASATIKQAMVPARCAGRGFLLIGSPPDVGSYVLPGNNYHVYDYTLFWANVRADAARRMTAYLR